MMLCVECKHCPKSVAMTRGQSDIGVESGEADSEFEGGKGGPNHKKAARMSGFEKIGKART